MVGEPSNAGPFLPSWIRLEACQGNLQHARGAMGVLEHSLRNARGPVVALLQEPYVYKSQVRGIGRRVGAVFAGHSETGLPTRVAIVATPGINSVIYLPQFCTRDQVAVCARYKCGGKDRRVVLRGEKRKKV